MKHTICIDIGATKIAAAIIDENAKIHHYFKIPTESNKCNKIIINNIIYIINTLVETCHGMSLRVKSINLSIAGQIDVKRGIIIKSPNFNKKFKNITIKKILEKKFKLPVYMDNDANCFALGEAYYGLGKQHQNIIGLTLGSGAGAGIVINKQIYHGKNNLAGEAGHLLINGLVWEKNKKNLKNINQISQAVYNLLQFLDPDIIIIAGGLSHLPKLLPKIRKKINNLIYYPALLKTPIKKSTLQARANLLGAYQLFI